METKLDHILVPAHDKDASAQFFVDLLELELRDHSVGSPPGLFAVAQVGDTGIDFAQSDSFESIHLAFAVDDALFDRAKDRLEAAGIAYSADPGHQKIGELNNYNGGRGLYFYDANGHNIELLTRP